MKKILIYSLFLIIPFLFVIGIKSSAREKKLPELSKEVKLELRNKILEAENANYQIQDLTKKRDQLISDINRQIEDIMHQYNIDKKDYGLDLQTISFIPVKK